MQSSAVIFMPKMQTILSFQSAVKNKSVYFLYEIKETAKIQNTRLSVNTGPLANGQWTLPADQWLFKLLAQIG